MLTAEQFFESFDKAGFLVTALWTPSNGGAMQTERVRFRAPTADSVGGGAISTDYSIEYPATKFARLANAETVRIEGSTNPNFNGTYRVREVPAMTEGAVMRAKLTKMEVG